MKNAWILWTAALFVGHTEFALGAAAELAPNPIKEPEPASSTPLTQPEPASPSLAQPEPASDPIKEPEPASSTPLTQPEPASDPIKEPEPASNSLTQPDPASDPIKEPEPASSTPLTQPEPASSPLTKPEAVPEKPESPVVCPAGTDPDDCLPLNLKERDLLLAHLYEYAVPTLIACDLAHENVLDLYTEEEDEEEFEDYERFSPLVARLPFPANPYRKPSPDKYDLFPSDEEHWKFIVSDWEWGFKYRETLIKLAEEILTTAREKKVIPVLGDNNVYLKGWLKRQPAYTQEEYNTTYALEEKAYNFLFDKHPTDLKYRPLEAAEEDALKSYIIIIKKEAEIFRTFLKKFAHMTFAEIQRNPDIKSYLLYGQKSAHDLINVKPLQVKERGDAEVIVVDWGYNRSSNLLKIKDKIPEKVKGEISPHGEQVAGVIAGKEELAQLKGVAPGAVVLPISELTSKTIERMRKSTARVINISAEFTIPMMCAVGFEDLSKAEKLGQVKLNVDENTEKACRVYWDFAELVKKKDMVVVQSAGNEALQVEKVDFKTGKVVNNLTYGMVGDQYFVEMENYKVNNVDLSNIFDQIPQLKDRVILAGNLLQDGVTIADTSSLPGAFPNDFLYAPSEGISTLGSGYLGKRVVEKKNPEHPRAVLKHEQGNIVPETEEQKEGMHEDIYGEIGEFGGTSGAAPRIAGVLVLLGKLFPDLTMIEIRKCALETGDPFWQEPNNRFTHLANLAKESGYDLKQPEPKGEKAETWQYLARLYGRGRINAMAAYHKCFELQEAKRKKVIGPSALDLARAKKPAIKKSAGGVSEHLQAQR